MYSIQNKKSSFVDSWLTNDLLKQIEDDESLSRYFSNPYFMEAINLFQHKPQEALAKYGDNAEVMKFFDRMAKILGKIQLLNISIYCSFRKSFYF